MQCSWTCAILSCMYSAVCAVGQVYMHQYHVSHHQIRVLSCMELQDGVLHADPPEQC